jgi:hypothetical protein
MWGEAQTILKWDFALETQHAASAEKKSTLHPLPFGAPQGCFAKGQTDISINHHHLGEVC